MNPDQILQPMLINSALFYILDMNFEVICKKVQSIILIKLSSLFFISKTETLKETSYPPSMLIPNLCVQITDSWSDF